MKAFLVYIIIFCSTLSCSQNSNNYLYTDFEIYFRNFFQVEVLAKSLEIDEGSVNALLGRIENSISNKLFLIDYSNWTLFMATNDGALIDKKGGIGRGPGEYQGINDLYTYKEEKLLQVFDKKLARLTYYDISADSLNFSHSVQLPNYGQSYLQNVYKSNGKTIGIFKEQVKSDDLQVENKLYVYILDEEFNKVEMVHEIPGSELIETEFSNGVRSFRENVFGNETVWSFVDDKFFYSNAKDLTFKAYNIVEDTISSYEISGIPDHFNSPEISELMIDKYSLMFNIIPEYEQYFKERKTLPIFDSIFASPPFLYIPFINYGYEKGYILRYNLETAQMERIETHPYFYMKGVNENGIYGTITESGFDDKTRISILEF